MRLVLIWFGAFKNAASTYAPRWVRPDAGRFPRAVVDAGTERPSATRARCRSRCCRCSRPNCSTPTGRRSSRLMRPPGRRRPGARRGHGAGRERGRACSATAATARPRPTRPGSSRCRRQLIAHLEEHADRLRPSWPSCGPRQGRRTTGTWSEVFGDGWEAEEVFMAWAFGELRAARWPAAGKAVKPLPMYANAWLGPQPGQPHGGGVPERRAPSAGAGRVEGGRAVAGPARPGHLRRRREGGDGRLRPAGQPAVHPRDAVPHGQPVLGARAPPGARLLGLRHRGRPPRQPAGPRLRPARPAGGRSSPRPRPRAGSPASCSTTARPRDLPARRARRSPPGAPASCSAGCCSTPVSSPRRHRRPRPARPAASARAAGAAGHPAVRAPASPRGRTSSCWSVRASTSTSARRAATVEIDSVRGAPFRAGRWVPRPAAERRRAAATSSRSTTSAPPGSPCCAHPTEADHDPAARHPRLPPRPVHLPGGGHLLPGDSSFEYAPGVPIFRARPTCVLGADRPRAGPARRSSTCRRPARRAGSSRRRCGTTTAGSG